MKGPDGLDCTPNSHPYAYGPWQFNGADNGVNFTRCAQWYNGGGRSTSAWPIKYATGEIQMSVVDLPASGYGLPWGHVRSYSNQLRDAAGDLTSADFGNGMNWLLRQAAYLVDAEGDLSRIVVVISPQNNVTFNLVGGGYVGAYGALQTLEHDTSAHVYRFIEKRGVVWEFFDFEQTDNPRGMLSRVLSQGNQATTLTYPDADGPVAEVQRSFTDPLGVTTVESFLYEYVSGTENEGNIETVTLRRNVDDSGWDYLRRVRFTYYDSASFGGGTGDLESALHQLPVGAGDWTTVDTYYYRYFRDAAGGVGFEHGLKFAVEPAAFRRLTAAVGDPNLATDAQVAQYADFYFEYDDQQRVVLERVQGGTQGITYAYSPSGNSAGFNSWQTKTVETRDDGTQIIVYTNFLGQVMLQELRSGTDQWMTYAQYDETLGSVILRASPSAVQGYDDTEPDLGGPTVIVKSAAGLVELTEYYTATDATPTTPGGAKGYVYRRKVSAGRDGDPTLLSEATYWQRNSTDDDPGADPVTIYPAAASTVYQSEASGGSVPATMSFAYEWYPGTVQMLQRTRTLPIIDAAQNGSGTANTQRMRLDEFGNMIWEQGPRNFVDQFIYDVTLGVLLQMLEDVEPPPEFGWPDPPDVPRLALQTDYEYDDLARVTQVLGPRHDVSGVDVRTATWTVYKDVEHEVRSARGYVTGTGAQLRATLVNPVTIARSAADDFAAEVIQAVRSATAGWPMAADGFPQSTWVGWARTTFDRAGRLVAARTYHTIPACGLGEPGVNYDEATYGYDAVGGRNRITSPGGTITRTTFDPRGLTTGTYVGTNDDGATDADPTNGGAAGNNLVRITARVYDDGDDGGDGNLTQFTQSVDANPAHDRVTAYVYDFRDRVIAVDGEESFYEQRTYDNLNRVVQSDLRVDDATGALSARAKRYFDAQGRIYRTESYGANASGDLTDPLVGLNWYDAAGNLIKEVAQGAKDLRAFTKQAFDGYGRKTAAYVGIFTGTLPESYSDAGQITDDNRIFEQTELTYDPAGDAVEMTVYSRFPDSTAVNKLTTSVARCSRAAVWYDGIGRAIADAMYGTASTPRPSAPPASSDTVPVSQTNYDESGRPLESIDPLGRITRQAYNAAGRVVRTIANYVPDAGADGETASSDDCCSARPPAAAPCAGDAQNVTVSRTYNADGNLATLTAHNPSAGDQTTRYLYGVTPADGSALYSNGLLQGVIYPAATDAADRTTYGYNRLGETIAMVDPNGTRREFTLDKRGRRTADAATVLGPDVDPAVRRLQTTYDERGRASSATGYDAASGGAVVNQVGFAYDAFGLVGEYQSHAGAVDVGTTPSVGYSYADATQNTIRRTAQVYPDGRTLTYSYGAADSDDDRLSRVRELVDDDATALAEYDYLGLGRIVRAAYPEPGVTWNLSPTGNTFSGLDSLDRIVNGPWLKSGTALAGASYQYDRASNRTQMQPLGYTAATNDRQRYQYDGLSRLTNLARGATVGPEGSERWSLDATGNWRGYDVLDAADPTRNLAQQRTADAANEITGIGAFYGPSWSVPVYDRAGNMTSFPRPLDPADAAGGAYDAWNRLVATNAAATVSYAYDALNRRTTLTTGGVTRHFYYSTRWQVLEERLDAAATPDRQFVWGLRYLDDQVCRDRWSGSLLLEGGDAQAPVGIAGVGSGWTASGMFKQSPSWTSGSGNGGLIGQWKGGPSPVDMAMLLQYNNAGLPGRVGIGADGDLQGWFGSGTNDGQWHQVVGRLDDAGVLSLWIDGAKVYDSAPTTFSNVTGNNVMIGKHAGTGEAFLGWMKHVRGWSQALSDAQIAAVYAVDTGGSGSFPTPDFYYPFAVDADDYSGNGNNATLSGSAAIDDGRERLYGLQDANWNLTAIVDASGTVQQRYRYDGYGQPTRLNPDGSAATGGDALLWDYLFAGYRYDRATGLYPVRERYYHPLLGIWLTSDPIRYKSKDLNLYRYVSNRPIVRIDSSGLQSGWLLSGANTYSGGSILTPGVQGVPISAASKNLAQAQRALEQTWSLRVADSCSRFQRDARDAICQTEGYIRDPASFINNPSYKMELVEFGITDPTQAGSLFNAWTEHQAIKLTITGTNTHYSPGVYYWDNGAVKSLSGGWPSRISTPADVSKCPGGLYERLVLPFNSPVDVAPPFILDFEGLLIEAIEGIGISFP